MSLSNCIKARGVAQRYLWCDIVDRDAQNAVLVVGVNQEVRLLVVARDSVPGRDVSVESLMWDDMFCPFVHIDEEDRKQDDDPTVGVLRVRVPSSHSERTANITLHVRHHTVQWDVLVPLTAHLFLRASGGQQSPGVAWVDPYDRSRGCICNAQRCADLNKTEPESTHEEIFRCHKCHSVVLGPSDIYRLNGKTIWSASERLPGVFVTKRRLVHPYKTGAALEHHKYLSGPLAPDLSYFHQVRCASCHCRLGTYFERHIDDRPSSQRQLYFQFHFRDLRQRTNILCTKEYGRTPEKVDPKRPSSSFDERKAEAGLKTIGKTVHSPPEEIRAAVELLSLRQ